MFTINMQVLGWQALGANMLTPAQTEQVMRMTQAQVLSDPSPLNDADIVRYNFLTSVFSSSNNNNNNSETPTINVVKYKIKWSAVSSNMRVI